MANRGELSSSFQTSRNLRWVPSSTTRELRKKGRFAEYRGLVIAAGSHEVEGSLEFYAKRSGHEFWQTEILQDSRSDTRLPQKLPIVSQYAQVVAAN